MLDPVTGLIDCVVAKEPKQAIHREVSMVDFFDTTSKSKVSRLTFNTWYTPTTPSCNNRELWITLQAEEILLYLLIQRAEQRGKIEG